jgi:exodeoxyribonuclease V alpha subunit
MLPGKVKKALPKKAARLNAPYGLRIMGLPTAGETKAAGSYPQSKKSMENSDIQILDGTIDRIVFSNEENGYTVARLTPDRGKEESATIVGALPGLRVGEHVRARGSWEENRKFGPQFKVSSCDIIPPSSAEGIEKYLSSGLIKGIGPVMAERIVARFGPAVGRNIRTCARR